MLTASCDHAVNSLQMLRPGLQSCCNQPRNMMHLSCDLVNTIWYLAMMSSVPFWHQMQLDQTYVMIVLSICHTVEVAAWGFCASLHAFLIGTEAKACITLVQGQ